MAKAVETGVKLVLVGNIEYVKLLAEKYGKNMSIGKIIEMEEMCNEKKQKKRGTRSEKFNSKRSV